jgi:CobQ-like glutamine amidotransferase family enzyme
VYGDAGNVQAILVRATARGIDVSVTEVRAGSPSIPTADLLVIGGGQDREQVAVARELGRLGPGIRAQIAAGASLLAVCGGYQNLGRWYRTGDGVTIDGPGILDLTTEAGADRMVGPVLAELRGGAGHWSGRMEIVGFENHAGRTRLGSSARPLATVEIGRGNNGEDGTEGILALPGEDGLAGLRIGTYLHGPFLPRNPHVADALIAAALARAGEPVALQRLDDIDEWAAHDGYAARSRARQRNERRVPHRLARFTRPLRSLIGF